MRYWILAACLLFYPNQAGANGGKPDNPFAWAADGFFPFPSNHYLISGRVDASASTWPLHVIEKTPVFADRALSQVGAHDGFSPNLPVLFSVPGEVDEASYGLNATGSIRLRDTADGSDVAVRIEQRTADEPGAGLLTVMALIPDARLTDGHTYLVTASNLRAPGGVLIERAPLAALRWQGASENIISVRVAVETWVPENERSHIQLAYTFTAAKNPYRTFEKLKKQVDFLAKHRPPVFTHNGLSRQYFSLIKRPGTTYDVHGSFRGWRFVGESGEILDMPLPHRVSVLMALPETCPARGCPVVIFCHGLQAMKETMMQVAGPLNAAGIAVIGVDGLWHERFTQSMHPVNGMRKHYEMFSGLIYQHVSLQWQLVHVIRNQLKDLDLLGGDGQPDLDPSRIGLIGQSLGGVAGVSAMAFDPALSAGIFNVAGGGYYQLFSTSMLKWMLRVQMIEVDGLSPVDGYKATLLASMANDFADPLQTAGRLAGDRRPMFLQVGFDDGLVPNEASDALARSLGLRLAEPPRPGKARGIALTGNTASLAGAYSYGEFGMGGFMHHLALAGEGQAAQTVKFFTEALKP